MGPIGGLMLSRSRHAVDRPGPTTLARARVRRRRDRRDGRYDRAVIAKALAAALLIAALAPATAGAAARRHCASSDLRYAFQPGLPSDFGVFELRVSGGSCSTAHQ